VRSGGATTVAIPGSVSEVRSSQRECSVSLQVTIDEVAVVELIRRTPYGDVIATTRAGDIVGLKRSETLRPPSLGKQPKLLTGGAP
jgi:hypothetical protein